MNNVLVRLRYCWLWLLLLFIFCGEVNSAENNQQLTQQNTTQTINNNPSNKLLSKTDIDKLSKRYAGKKLEVVDVSHVVLDGASSLVITFNMPIDADQKFEKYIEVREDKTEGESKNIYDGWELSPKQTELRRRYLEPDTKYLVIIKSGIKSITGEELESYDNIDVSLEPKSYTIETPQLWPTIGFTSKGSLLPTKVIEGLPIIALNVNSVDVDFFRIKPESMASFINNWQNKTTMDSWDAKDYLADADLVYGARFDLKTKHNTRENLILPLQDAKALQEPGVYLAVMRKSGNYNDYSLPVSLFTLSDVGVSVHRSNGSDIELDIFSHSIEDGKILPNVNIQILNRSGRVEVEKKTDQSGYVHISYGGAWDNLYLLMATYNGQTSLISLDKGALDLTEFAITGPESRNLQFFAFGPRDIYRPGEKVLINGLLRNIDGQPTLTQPIKVDVLRPDNKVATSFLWHPSEQGFYQSSYTLAKDVPTGNWRMRFELGDSYYRYYDFKVEDFLPERMALDIKNTDENSLSCNNRTSFDITGRYLYGAPAADNKLQGQLLLRPLRNAVETLSGFYFGSVNEKLSRRLDEFDMTLDGNGQAEINLNDDWCDAQSPASLILQASLLESGGRPVTRTVYQSVWPASELPGIRPLFGQKDVYNYRNDNYTKEFSVDENSYAEFEIVYTNKQGEKLAVEDLDVRLVYERRDYYWNWSSEEGWSTGYNQRDIVQDSSQISISEGQTAKVGFMVDWGSYRLEVIDRETGLLSSVRFWAGYSWQDNTSNGGGARPDQVKMKLDKASYKPGEKVKLTVEAPQAGNGYLLVESSAGMLWWQEISVPEGGTQFDVPINKEWQRHDLYLSALVIRPGDKKIHATPKRAIGVLHLPMADNDRKLNVTLDTPAKIEPNKTLTVKVNIDSKHLNTDKPVKVLVSAVDTGVLNITNFKTPDPYQNFFSRKAYVIDQFDVYSQLIEGKGRLASLRYGGDGEEDEGTLTSGGKKPVSKVNIVALQAEPVIVNDKGEAEVTLAIPDFNGELRLMAQAWNETDFGNGESKVTVAAPLTVELGAPRFMSGGDNSQLALDITNLSGGTQTITLNVNTSGLVELISPIKQDITLDNGKKTTISVPITAANGFGQGDITVMVAGKKESDQINVSRHWTIGVRPAQPAKTRSEMIALASGELIKSSVLDQLSMDLNLDTLEAELSLTSSPPLNLSQYIRQLYAYPYGCAEQTTSGLYPSLYTTSAQLAALKIKGSDDEQRRESIKIGIARLLGMQRQNGSFGLWSSSSNESYWVTVYVTDFLLRAREQGYFVPEDALAKAMERLQYYIQERNLNVGYSDNNNYTRFAVQSYAALVLARQQKAPLGHLRQIYENRVLAVSGLPAVQLGIALNLMGDKQRGESLIAEGMTITRTYNKYYYWYSDYGSDVRDTALITALLIENNLLTDRIPKLLLDLSFKLQDKKYLSTQELNAVYMAGHSLIGKNEPEWQAEIHKLSNQAVDKFNNKQALTIRMNGNQFDDLSTIHNTGNNTIYATFNVVGYSDKPQEPESNVMSIERSYFDVYGQPVNVEKLESGQLVIVKLDVSTKNKPIHDALVVDLLPAGLELENQNLENGANLANNSVELSTYLNKMQQTTIFNQEFRDDRYVAAISVEPGHSALLLYLARVVTPGSYNVPAPMVESMYQPELYAIGRTVDKLIVSNNKK